MIVAIVPAAGQSRRMGVHKQLLPFAGATVIRHIVDALCRSRIDDVRVIVGHRSDDLRRALDGLPVRIVENRDYERTDMLASIRCGLADVPADCHAILVALGDQPSITSELIEAMIDRFSTCGRGIIVPTHDGRRGHPILLDARYRDEILSGYDQVGLRGLLAEHADDVFELPVSTPAILSDMNSPDDYRRELARLNQARP